MDNGYGLIVIVVTTKIQPKHFVVFWDCLSLKLTFIVINHLSHQQLKIPNFIKQAAAHLKRILSMIWVNVVDRNILLILMMATKIGLFVVHQNR